MTDQRAGHAQTDAHTEAEIRELARADIEPEMKAQRIAREIRRARRYRWVGLYGVSASEIWVIAWDGPGAPAHPRFPSDSGLCGAAVASATTVIVDDVTRDPRYMTTFGTTRSEMVVPISDSGSVLGLIDVESDTPAAFDLGDRHAVERWGAAAAPLWHDVNDRMRTAETASTTPEAYE